MGCAISRANSRSARGALQNRYQEPKVCIKGEFCPDDIHTIRTSQDRLEGNYQKQKVVQQTQFVSSSRNSPLNNASKASIKQISNSNFDRSNFNRSSQLRHSKKRYKYGNSHNISSSSVRSGNIASLNSTIGTPTSMSNGVATPEIIQKPNNESSRVDVIDKYKTVQPEDTIGNKKYNIYDQNHTTIPLNTQGVTAAYNSKCSRLI